MFAYIIRQLKGMQNVDYYVADGNIYITKGSADDYPCMVAHMDTVHDIVEDLYPLEIDGCITGFNRVTMEQTGIGGDDKVGIYITLEMLEKFDVFKCAFFRDEEVGCVGSYDAHMHFFRDCRFVLQCDRKGNSDFITTASGVELSSNSFQEDVLPIIQRYGYNFASGMMTDVMALKENGIKCCVANISCGYYNPHMPNEYVNVYDVENCLEMCQTIISNLTKVYKHKYKPRVWTQVSANSKYPKTTKATTKSWDWHQPKSNSVIDWDESDKHCRPKETDTYCQDCWGAEATHNGLCKTCYAWYKDHNDVF
jgi:hypothetical protein